MKRRILSVLTALALAAAFMPTTFAAGMREVTVSTAEELLDAISSDTKITLQPGVYTTESCIEVREIANLEINGNGQAEIKTKDGYDAVIGVYSSENVTLSGLTLGHDLPQYGCQWDGVVVRAYSSKNVLIQGCDMYGCGILGLDTYSCAGVTVENSVIRDCETAIIASRDSITFNHCSFLRNAYAGGGEALLDVYKEVEKNGGRYIDTLPVPTITFNECDFRDNMNDAFYNPEAYNVVINNCSASNNTWGGLERPITVKLDGKSVEFEGQRPAMVNNRVLVPVRAIFEALGATLDWDNATQTATAVRGGKSVQITIGSDTMTVNGAAKTLDVPAQLVNNRTMVPLRAVGEAFDCTVSWDGAAQTAMIEQ